jgi:hypothetical protein
MVFGLHVVECTTRLHERSMPRTLSKPNHRVETRLLHQNHTQGPPGPTGHAMDLHPQPSPTVIVYARPTNPLRMETFASSNTPNGGMDVRDG